MIEDINIIMWFKKCLYRKMNFASLRLRITNQGLEVRGSSSCPDIYTLLLPFWDSQAPASMLMSTVLLLGLHLSALMLKSARLWAYTNLWVLFPSSCVAQFEVFNLLLKTWVQHVPAPVPGSTSFCSGSDIYKLLLQCWGLLVLTPVLSSTSFNSSSEIY